MALARITTHCNNVLNPLGTNCNNVINPLGDFSFFYMMATTTFHSNEKFFRVREGALILLKGNKSIVQSHVQRFPMLHLSLIS